MHMNENDSSSLLQGMQTLGSLQRLLIVLGPLEHARISL